MESCLPLSEVAGDVGILPGEAGRGARGSFPKSRRVPRGFCLGAVGLGSADRGRAEGTSRFLWTKSVLLEALFCGKSAPPKQLPSSEPGP